jgi:hypothetical protein
MWSVHDHRSEEMTSVSHTTICSEDEKHLDTPHAISLKEILHNIFRNLHVQKNKENRTMQQNHHLRTCGVKPSKYKGSEQVQSRSIET